MSTATAGSPAASCPAPRGDGLDALDGKELGELSARDDAGFFEGAVAIKKRQPVRYRARNDGGEWDVVDPYSFGPVLGPMDDYYIGEGSHLRLFDKLGAHPMTHEGATAPFRRLGAERPARLGGRRFQRLGRPPPPDALRRDTGIWEIFMPGIGAGSAYKFEIVGATANCCR
jgi:1,4-alpha-glucan branching enzyme